MTTPDGPLHQYLGQLRANLRTADASLILAEAEDHLRESVAAGLAAGLTELEAQEAAISSFGSVRAVARAHQSRRSRTAAVLTGLAMAAWKLTWLLLLAYDVSTHGHVRLPQDWVLPAGGGECLRRRQHRAVLAEDQRCRASEQIPHRRIPGPGRRLRGPDVADPAAPAEDGMTTPLWLRG
jgi:hypothetical protein